nr:uncharacterized protein si:ch211-274k16.2 isoform X1 [Danio rerio]|eukprot:XP_021325211.1 uncharacterized protein si:ch211-274k16.2 isoform X1 [Danio rerio]
MKMLTRLVLFCLCCCHLADAVKSVSVTEGDSVTLNSDLTELPTGRLIMWKFEPNGNLLAKIDLTSKLISIFDKGEFRGRLKVDNQTASLTITDSKKTDAGVYIMSISHNIKRTFLFNVTVYARLPVPVIISESPPNSSSSSSSVQYCSVLCSVVNVSAASLSWYKGNRLLSSISVSDLNNSFPLHMECLDGSYSCVVSNPISNQTQHVNNTEHCQPCSGASGEIVESVSVTVGDSLTLHTKVNQMELGSVLEWRFEKKMIALINSDPNKITHVITNTSDRLELNRQSGNLKIMNVKMADSGLYELDIISPSGSTSNIFNVIVINKASDGVRVESVRERDSVILPTGLNQIRRDDRLTWKFEGTIIAQINQTGIFPHDVLDGRFKNRLHLNPWTGSLTITNVKSNTSGEYVLDISKSSSGFTTHKTFSVTTIDGDNMVSTTEGTTVILASGVFEIHQDDVIIWRSEHGDSVIAKISNGTFSTFDGADGRFRDTLKLDHQTGSLTIRNIKTEHAGLYHMDMIGSRRTVFKRISLSVCPRDWSVCLIAVVAVAFLLLVLAGVILVRGKMGCCCSDHGEKRTEDGMKIMELKGKGRKMNRI